MFYNKILEEIRDSIKSRHIQGLDFNVGVVTDPNSNFDEYEDCLIEIKDYNNLFCKIVLSTKILGDTEKYAIAYSFNELGLDYHNFSSPDREYIDVLIDDLLSDFASHLHTVIDNKITISGGN